MYNDEDDLAAYEDELYREESSSDEGVDSEVEAFLYSQVHYSQNLSDDEVDESKKDDAAAAEKTENAQTNSVKEKSVIVISDSDEVRASDSSAVIILSESLEEDSVCSSKIKRKALSAVRRPEMESTPKVSPGGKKKSSALRGAKSPSCGKNYKDGIVQEVVVIRGSSDEGDEGVEEEEVFLTSDSDQSDVENWMVLGGPREDGDTSIQLNLEGCRSAPDKGDDGEEWLIGERDAEARNTKYNPLRRSSLRYYTDDKNVICRNCNQRGHLSKNCPQPRKLPACCLCGKRGHLQYTCPTPYCANCFMAGHFYQDCSERPYWQKKCHRCGMIGHYADGCPEIWRQYHLTVVRGPLKKSSSACNPKNIVYCYNCGRKGHCGYECIQRRMYSTVHPSCELVFTYDQNHDIWKRNERAKQKMKELQEAGLVILEAEASDVEDTVNDTQLPKKLMKRNKKVFKKQKKAEDDFARKSLRRFKDKKKKLFLQHEEEREYFPRGKSEKPQKIRRGQKTKKPEHILFEDFGQNEGLDDRLRKGKKKWRKQKHSEIDASLLMIKQRKKKNR